MPQQAHILRVLIASPGDVKAEREAIANELEEWNREHQHSKDRIRLEAFRWEFDAVPKLGYDDVQSVINQQLVDEVDIVIAVLHSRLGTPTSRAASGTAEEIDRTVQAGKPVHVYFSRKPVSIHHDAEQLQSVREFERQLNARGYAGTFTSTNELRRQTRRAITRDVDKFKDQINIKSAQPSPSMPQGQPEPAASEKSTPAKRSRNQESNLRRVILEIAVSGDATVVASRSGPGVLLLRNFAIRNIGDTGARHVSIASGQPFQNVSEAKSKSQTNIPPGGEATLLQQPVLMGEVYVGWLEGSKPAFARCVISDKGAYYPTQRLL